ncbi:lipopolysaccharide core heptose(II) kinase RfaY [Psychrilyobacter sp.]|uniref:lipopolysaccharide core heptose(II) kinase RfaY n=1 Tax=Psychrilyobacter sp. TaxID=2586924 RepID=UPI00301A586C
MKTKKINDITIYYRDEKYLKILDALENLKIEKVFKDDNRSKVSLFTFEGDKLVFKVPREKNSRKWQRFLSIFRGSESYREYIQAEKIHRAGLWTYKPILAFEKRKYGFVVDSYFICEYLLGETGSIKHLKVIESELDKIHQLGYLHGDSQLVNFIIDNKHVYLIDSKFSKNKYGKFGARYEYIYLEESCPREMDYEKKDIYYRGAKGLNSFLHIWGRIKKKLKNK